MASPVKRDPDPAPKQEETLDIKEIYDGKNESYRVPQLSSSPPPSHQSSNGSIRLLPLPGANCRRCIECSAQGSRIRRSHHICSKCNQGVHKMCFPNHQFKCGIFFVAEGTHLRHTNRSTYLPSINRHDVNIKDENKVTVVDDRLRCYYCTFKTLWKRLLIEHIRFNHLRYVRHPGLLKSVVAHVRAPKSRLLPASSRWSLRLNRESAAHEVGEDAGSESFTLPIDFDDVSEEEESAAAPKAVIDLGECRLRILSTGEVEEIKKKEELRPDTAQRTDVRNNIVISDDELLYAEEGNDAIRREFGGLVVLAGVDTEEEELEREDEPFPTSSGRPTDLSKGDTPKDDPPPPTPSHRSEPQPEKKPKEPRLPPPRSPATTKPKVKLGRGGGGRRKCSSTGAIMHRCDWCNYASSRRYNVRTHMKRRHAREYLGQPGGGDGGGGGAVGGGGVPSDDEVGEDTAKLRLYLTRGEGAPYTCTVVGADTPAAP